MSVSRTVYEILSVKWWRDLEIRVRGRSRSLKFGTIYLFKHFTVHIEHGRKTKAWIDFLFAFHSCGAVLYDYRDKTIYWSKMAIFSHPCIRRRRYGGPRQNIAVTFGAEKIEWCGYKKVKNEDFKVTIIQRRITRKWFNIELCLQ